MGVSYPGRKPKSRKAQEGPLFKTPSPVPVKLSEEEILLNQLSAEEKKLEAASELPHLYGFKWYPWAARFRDSTNSVNLLCAGNQISKSSTQIRKCIIWATDQELWPDLWARKPLQFWYLYPTQKQVNAEFETKWKQFLPRGKMKDDNWYGWKEVRTSGNVVGVQFKSGVMVYFKTYQQKSSALQSGTVDALFTDEEIPQEHFDELMLRISASAGYFHMVFTATLGQEFWRKAMCPEDGEEEVLPNAFKQTVSLYDAMVYEDGTPSHWTMEKIKLVEARCSTAAEVLKRVHGKFILLEGRKYESFDIKKHMKKAHAIPPSWLIYCGADIGGGGEKAHKAAIVYVAVNPNFREGRVFLGWEGATGINTTAGDVVNKYINMTEENKLNITAKYYDWQSKDFGEIATRMGHPFEKAEKSHEKGEEVINTLFKNNMLYIYEEPELMKLASQLASLKKGATKRTAIDDIADAFRYAVTKIPWDWSALTGAQDDLEEKLEEPLTEMQRQILERRKQFDKHQALEEQSIEAEFDEWNDAYGS